MRLQAGVVLVASADALSLRKRFLGAPDRIAAGTDEAQVTAEFKNSTDSGVMHKSGFTSVGCFNDGMLATGDKFGKGTAFSADTPDSVIRYDKVVASTEQKSDYMSPDMCYRFCRKFQHMSYFGIQNGRNCYCETSYAPVAGGGEECNVPCPGDKTKKCGSQSKSSIYAMHECPTPVMFSNNETAQMNIDGNEVDQLYNRIEMSTGVVQRLTSYQAKVQGIKGNKVVMKHQQAAIANHKYYVKKLQALPFNAEDISAAVRNAVTTYQHEMQAGANEVRARELYDTLMAANKAAAEAAPALRRMHDQTTTYKFGTMDNNREVIDGVVDTFYKELPGSAPVCDGEVIQPIPYAKSEAACATLCQQTISPNRCVGYQFLKYCMMFSKITAFTRYQEEGCQFVPGATTTCKIQKSQYTMEKAVVENSEENVVLDSCYLDQVDIEELKKLAAEGDESQG